MTDLPPTDDDSFLVGGRERRDIVLVDYDPSWPERFEAERTKIERALGPLALRIEHIGSTAVRAWRPSP